MVTALSSPQSLFFLLFLKGRTSAVLFTYHGISYCATAMKNVVASLRFDREEER